MHNARHKLPPDVKFGTTMHYIFLPLIICSSLYRVVSAALVLLVKLIYCFCLHLRVVDEFSAFLALQRIFRSASFVRDKLR